MKPTLGLFVALSFLGGLSSHAGEPISVSGLVEVAPPGSALSSHFLRDPLTGRLIAGLRDPRQVLVPGKKRVTIEAETTLTPDLNGLPILRIINVVPESWTQPSIFSTEQKLPGSFSGPQGPAAKDFAGTPFTEYRSYGNDNGLDRRSLDLLTGLGTPGPLRLLNPQVDPQQFLGSFEAQAGVTYELQFLPTLEDTPSTISSLTAPSTGLLSISGPRQSEKMGIYLLRAVTLSP